MSPSLPRPEEFFTPGLDAGLWLLQAEDLSPRLTTRVDVGATVLGSWVDHRLAARSTFERIRKQELWSESVIFPDVLALVENLTFTRKRAMVNGKYLLLGAAGDRMRFNVHLTARSTGQEDVEQAIADHLARSRMEAGPLPVTQEKDWQSLPFVIEARNFFNFYHFTRETLPALVLAARYGLTGPIHIIGPKSDEGRFVRESIATWFPDLADRVSLVTEYPDYPRALIVLPVKSLYRQSNHAHVPAISTSANDRVPRRPVVATAEAMSLNSVEDSVIALRAQALAQLPPTANATRRLYVGRRSQRLRPVGGEDYLLEKLSAIGFETVYFEDMSIARQAAIMQEAEAVVTLHGAGVTNMLFVSKGCHVFELSNLQTLRKRFGDFNALALAAGARHHHIFLDHDYDDPKTVPNIGRDGLRGVQISAFEAEAIAAEINATLDPAGFDIALATCRASNDTGTGDDLAALLDRHAAILAHCADYHVWRANTFSTAGGRAMALPHLRRAMVIAPRREPLLQRILVLARNCGADAIFQEATRSYGALSVDKAAAFFATKGWPYDPDRQDFPHLPL